MNIYFGENLKKLRIKKNLTQEKLADFLGVSFQTISKWERGDTYPDITMLPDIASFFKVSVDDLLGFNKTETEAEIVEQLTAYDNLTDDKIIRKMIFELKDKYPNDFRVLLRYMSWHVHYENAVEVKNKVISIYEHIMQNCTNDTIRMCAKRHIAQFYCKLSEIDDSGITFDDCESIIKEMPRMRDGQEFLSAYLYPKNHPDYYANIQEAIEEGIGLLFTAIDHYFLYDDNFTVDFKIDIIEKSIQILDLLYDDGNYGEMWRAVMYYYGHLGHLYFEKNDNENALINLETGALVAKQFDELDRITTMHSKLFEGRNFDKHVLGSNHIAKSRMKYLMTEKYPLTDEFKNSTQFQKILNILE